MDNFDWANFAAVTRDHEHHFLVEKAEALVPAGKQERRALDLGCGAGRNTRFLLARGWHVTAVDAEPAAIAAVSEITSENLTVVQSKHRVAVLADPCRDAIKRRPSADLERGCDSSEHRSTTLNGRQLDQPRAAI